MKGLIILSLFLLFLGCQVDSSLDKEDCSSLARSQNKTLGEIHSAKTLPDSVEMLKHWEKIEKEHIAMDSLEAWEFAWENSILENYSGDYQDVLSVKMIKQQINSLYEQIFMTINNEFSYLYQRNNKKEWKALWSSFNEEGNAPKLLTASGNWIESTYYYPCSYCSNEGSTYYKIYEDSVVELIQISNSFNLDHESSSDELILYEQCNALVEFNKSKFRVTYDICFSEIESQTIFIKNHLVKVVYAVDENLNQMVIEEVSPKELKPFILKWHKKGEEYYSCYGYQPNNEVLLAYFDYKKEYLLQLKHKEEMLNIIKKIETSYREPWDSLMTNWSFCYSFALFD